MRTRLLRLCFTMRSVAHTTRQCSDRFIARLATHNERLRLRLLYLSPTPFISTDLTTKHDTTLFDTALTPPSFCHDILNYDSTHTITLSDPFPTRGLKLCYLPGVSAHCHSHRTDIRTISSTLTQLIRTEAKGCFTFFPDCTCLQRMRRSFTTHCPNVHALIRRDHLSSTTQTRFLTRFIPSPTRALLNFNIVNNVFNRKISLTNDHLVKYTVININLPRMGPRRRVLHHCCSTRGNFKFSCTCHCPNVGGMLRTTKHIVHAPRSENTILLLSSQFTRRRCVQLFPPR